MWTTAEVVPASICLAMEVASSMGGGVDRDRVGLLRGLAGLGLGWVPEEAAVSMPITWP